MTYQGIDGEEQSSDVVIDLDIYKSRMYTEILGIHHAARALRDISKTQKQWSESPQGIKVFSRDGEAKDARVAEAAQRWKARRAAERAGKTQNELKD